MRGGDRCQSSWRRETQHRVDSHWAWSGSEERSSADCLGHDQGTLCRPPKGNLAPALASHQLHREQGSIGKLERHSYVWDAELCGRRATIAIVAVQQL